MINQIKPNIRNSGDKLKTVLDVKWNEKTATATFTGTEEKVLAVFGDILKATGMRGSVQSAGEALGRDNGPGATYELALPTFGRVTMHRVSDTDQIVMNYGLRNWDDEIEKSSVGPKIQGVLGQLGYLSSDKM
jgi:hypothetical protein